MFYLSSSLVTQATDQSFPSCSILGCCLHLTIVIETFGSISFSRSLFHVFLGLPIPLCPLDVHFCACLSMCSSPHLNNVFKTVTFSCSYSNQHRLMSSFTPCIFSHLQRITDAEVLRRTNQIQISTVLHGRRLRLFGYVARSDGKLDHTRALRTVISGLPSHWRRPPDRPRWTWKADRRKGSECTQHRPKCGKETSAGS